MLEFKNLFVEYEVGMQALKNFTLKVKEGEIIALVGESGSGKTTAIRAAMGLLPIGGKIVSGDILLQGQSMSQFSLKEWERVRGLELGMIFQDSGAMLNPIRTVGSQFIEYIRKHDNISKGDAHKRSVELLEQMGLYDGESIMKLIPSKLSGGMRQRVGIAMAMAFKPSVLLADEPTSALDVTIQAQIVRQMMELRKRYHTSILMVTHNIGVAAYMADQIIVMKGGEIVERGSREEILNNPKERYTKKLISAVPTIRGERYV